VIQRGDRVFSGAATTAGVLILLVLAGVAAFLLVEAAPALTTPAEAIPGGEGLVAYIWPLVFGTLLAAVLALLLATPLAVSVALFITHYAPAGSRSPSGTWSTCSPPCPASSTGSGGSRSSARPRSTS
jgi:phosphate transport system permease protein